MSDKKAELLTLLTENMDELARVVNQIANGDRTYSEAGDWLYEWGSDIWSAMNNARDYIIGGGGE